MAGRPSSSTSTDPWRVVPVLVGLLSCLAIVAVALGFLGRERIRQRLYTYVVTVATPSLEAEGRAIVEALAADVDTLPGVDAHRLELRHGEVRLHLASFHASELDASCPGSPDWVRAPGAVLITPTGDPDLQHARSRGDWQVSWFWCETSPEREQAAATFAEGVLARPDLDRIWNRRTRPLIPSVHRPSGLLLPAARASGLSHESLCILVLVLGVAATAAAGFGLGPRLRTVADASPEPARDGASKGVRTWIAGHAAICLATLVLALTWARVNMASYLPIDDDETWALRLRPTIFHEGHDPWVHPPLYHLLQQPWVAAVDGDLGDPLLLRAPALLAGVLATAMILAAVGARARRPARVWLWLLALPCTFAMQVGSDLTLGRPYALATLLVTIVAVGLWPVAEGQLEATKLARARWWMILLAAGLAAWTDVVAGFAALALITVHLLARPRVERDGWAKIAVLLLALAWIAPLLPGMVEALHHHIDPEVDQATLDSLGIMRPGDVRPDPRLTRSLPAVMMFGVLRPAG
ncbi:MAG: hypothetical protein KC431_17625, partial [Myxococcales bacterium]|nr:hypothetical protein [Myxococcales bacterium]